jgi:hypothetical protein
LLGEGFQSERVFGVRLGVDDDGPAPASVEAVRDVLTSHGVTGPFTLYVGTREPRKNLQRLVEAHREARAANRELGPLVLVGPSGWGGVETGDATVFAYVAVAEGWGLPPVEALHAGTRVVASITTPSVLSNPEVTGVDPLDVASIAQGLVRALASDGDDISQARRRESVAGLTWANSALDHLAGWS